MWEGVLYNIIFTELPFKTVSVTSLRFTEYVYLWASTCLLLKRDVTESSAAITSTIADTPMRQLNLQIPFATGYLIGRQFMHLWRYEQSPAAAEVTHGYTRHSPTVGSMLGRRRRRWPSIEPASGERVCLGSDDNRDGARSLCDSCFTGAEGTTQKFHEHCKG